MTTSHRRHERQSPRTPVRRIRWSAVGACLAAGLLASACQAGTASGHADGADSAATGNRADDSAVTSTSHSVHRARPAAAAHHATKSPRPAPRKPRPSPRRRILPAGVGAAFMPVASLTPGVALTTGRATVCTPGYASRVRDVSEAEKREVYARYDVAWVPYAHEVDHLVSLELGGSNSITNLWPEPYAGAWGARTKDVLENRLHDLVCAGSLSLASAQRQESHNWVAAYRKYVGARPSTPVRSTPPAPTRPPRSTSGGSCEPGYSPCLPVASDLDCGQIPSADKPVRVTGSDPYGLDADRDGWGCTSG